MRCDAGAVRGNPTLQDAYKWLPPFQMKAGEPRSEFRVQKKASRGVGKQSCEVDRKAFRSSNGRPFHFCDFLERGYPLFMLVHKQAARDTPIIISKV